MNKLAKSLALWLFGDYSIYRIARRDVSGSRPPTPQDTALEIVQVDRATIDACDEPLMREQAWYAGHGAHSFACIDGDRVVALCFYWHGQRYRERNFWPLRDREAKLVQIVTDPAWRGRGLAAALIEHSSRVMAAQGFERLYARIWHSNEPSLRAFARAGWTLTATVIEVHFFRRRAASRWVFRHEPEPG